MVSSPHSTKKLNLLKLFSHKTIKYIHTTV